MNNLRYADDIVTPGASHKKLDMLVIKSKKRSPINCIYSECMVLAKRSGRPDCVFAIRDNVI